MPITFFACQGLRFQVAKLEGRVAYQEFLAMGRMHQGNEVYASADVIHLIDAAADVTDLTYARLDAARAQYRTLHKRLDFHVVRRSGFVAPAADAWNRAAYWLKGRHAFDGQGTEVLLSPDIEGLVGLFFPEEVAAVIAWRGMVELFRFDAAVAAP